MSTGSLYKTNKKSQRGDNRLNDDLGHRGVSSDAERQGKDTTSVPETDSATLERSGAQGFKVLIFGSGEISNGLRAASDLSSSRIVVSLHCHGPYLSLSLNTLVVACNALCQVEQKV